MLGMCNGVDSREWAYPCQWAGENVQIFLKEISLMDILLMITSALLGLKPALKFNPKQKFYFNRQAKTQTKKKLPYQARILKTSTYLPLQE